MRIKIRETYKYRLYPTKAQEAKLHGTLETCRILYNSCLVDRRNHYQKTGKGLSRITLQKILVTDKNRVPMLKEIHTQVLHDVLFRIERAYQAFFRRLAGTQGKAGSPRYKFEGRYNSITYSEHLSRYYWKPVFWSRSYCLLSCGGAPLSVIRQYIEQQSGFN